jgi:hypothetical protein
LRGGIINVGEGVFVSTKAICSFCGSMGEKIREELRVCKDEE